MYEYFEFANITEMRWIRFYQQIMKTIQLEDGSFTESPRSKILLSEAKRQSEEHKMGYNFDPKNGPLYINWKGALYNQEISMYEIEETNGANSSVIEFKIIIPLKKDFSEEDIAKIVERISLDFSLDYTYKGSVESIVVDVLRNCTNGKAGFTYCIYDNNIVLLQRHIFGSKDENTIYSFVIPLLYRQHAYAFYVHLGFKLFDMLAEDFDYDLNNFDPFILNILNPSFNKSLIDKGIFGEIPGSKSPEGISENLLFFGLNKEIIFDNIMKNIRSVTESDVVAFEFQTDSKTHRKLYGINNDFIILEYSNDVEPQLYYGGSIMNSVDDGCTIDPTLTFYYRKTHQFTTKNEIDRWEERKLPKEYLYNTAYEMEIQYFNEVLKNNKLSYIGNIDIRFINNYSYSITYELAISLSQLGLLVINNDTESSKIISDYLINFMFESYY